MHQDLCNKILETGHLILSPDLYLLNVEIVFSWGELPEAQSYLIKMP